MFLFDLELLKPVQVFDRKQVCSTDEARKAEADRRMEDFLEIKRQWKDIDSSQSQFNKSYLQDNYFVPVWVEGLRIVKEAIGSNKGSGNQIQKQSEYIRILTYYESLACNLRDQMVGTARQGLLEKEVLYSIQERWIRLDEILDWYYDFDNRHLGEDIPPTSRWAPKWSVQNSDLDREH